MGYALRGASPVLCLSCLAAVSLKTHFDDITYLPSHFLLELEEASRTTSGSHRQRCSLTGFRVTWRPEMLCRSVSRWHTFRRLPSCLSLRSKEYGMDASSHMNHRSAGLTRGTAMTFVILLGVVSLFADMTYEGARSITGPYL